MKVLVTGGLGFVGSEICHQLNHPDRFNLVVLDDGS